MEEKRGSLSVAFMTIIESEREARKRKVFDTDFIIPGLLFGLGVTWLIIGTYFNLISKSFLGQEITAFNVAFALVVPTIILGLAIAYTLITLKEKSDSRKG